jgi:hypothetical protein
MPWYGMTMKDVAACDKPRLGGKQPLTRGFPNGATQSDGRSDYHCLNKIGQAKVTWGSETSQYPEEEKTPIRGSVTIIRDNVSGW